MDLALRPLFQGNTSDISAFGKEKRLSLVLKVYTRLPSKVNLNAPRPGVRNAPIIKAVATFEPKHFDQSENSVKQDNELQLGSQSSSQTFLSPSEDSIEMGEREISRRMKISKANKGNVPWNKGRKHSPETIRRIRERTRQAMQDPKIKMKLANLGHPQRPRDNEKIQDELDKAVQVFWNSGLPSPRCVAIDAIVEDELASALGVSVFPELIFTKAGKILYREKVIRTADELSKIMAFFFYGAFRPPCLNESVGDSQERIPSMS